MADPAFAELLTALDIVVMERLPDRSFQVLGPLPDWFVPIHGASASGDSAELERAFPFLDHFLEEYFWRPSGIVCYSAGGFGGVRAAMQLRMTLAELGMSSVPSLLPIPRIGDSLDDEGTPQDPRIDRSANRFLNEFLWYASALAEARANGTPY